MDCNPITLDYSGDEMIFKDYNCKWIVSPEEMTTRGNYAIYKYVIFEDGEILFCEVQKNHADILGELKFFGVSHGNPMSAGRIVVDLWKGYPRWNHLEIGSFTLGIKGDWDLDRLAIMAKLEGFTFDPELYG